MAKVSTFKNMVTTLFITAFVSSALLAGVFTLTEESIEKVKTEKINSGISNVLPEFDNKPSENISKIFLNDTVFVFTATKEEKLAGMAVQTFSDNGYGGRIVLMVGFLPCGEIHKIDVISHTETPGLGDKIDAKKDNFSLQFYGKNPENFKLWVKKEGGDVDAISATTISSKAFCDAVDRAYKAFLEEMAKTYPEYLGKVENYINASSGATTNN